MAEQKAPNIGARIRALREEQGHSLRSLAELCGLSFNAISRVERGENSPTVSTLHRLATALGVPITAFFSAGTEATATFTGRGEGLRSTLNGLEMQSLGGGLPSQQLQPFQMTIAPDCGNLDAPVTHAGEEFVHCLEGQLEYRVDSESFRLQTGDSLLFKATQPHCWHNHGAVPATLLIVFQAQGRQEVLESHTQK